MNFEYIPHSPLKINFRAIGGKRLFFPAGAKNIPIISKRLRRPFNTIRCVNKGKILGRVMEPAFKMNHAVINGISEAKIARSAARYKIPTYNDANAKLKLILVNSLIGRISYMPYI